jgi:membrane protease YdiL (CAAX protease family)
MDQQGIASIALSAAVAAIGFTLMGFFVGWTWVFIRWNNQQPILEFEPRRPVPWTVVSLAVAIFGFVVLLTSVSSVIREIVRPPIDDDTSAASDPVPPANEAGNEVKPALPNNAPSNRPTAPNQAPRNRGAGAAKAAFPTIAIWLNSGINLTFVVLAVGGLLATGATTRDMGITLEHWKRDLVTGVFGFCTIAPMVLMLQAVLVKWWQPSAHPLIESLRSNLTLDCWLAVATAAVFVAPIFEEFMFRVFFQGWLEGVCDTLGQLPDLELPRQLVAENSPTASAADPHNPYLSPNQMGERPALVWQEVRTPAGDWLPIAVSSIVFALMHFGHGPDWVTLIPFAVMLGFLYRRTHRIWPSVIAHLMLNGFSMTIFTTSLFWPGAVPK